MSNTVEARQPTDKARSVARGHAPSLLQEFAALILKIAIVGLVLVVLFTFVFGMHRNLDPAMAPAIKDGDLVIFYRLDKDYVFGDTLLLTYEGKPQVRRVVAVAGDTVDIADGHLIINGAIQQEFNIYTPTDRYENNVAFPLTLDQGQVFVLADNRENATDGRVYGPVNTKDTLGKVMALLRRRGI